MGRLGRPVSEGSIPACAGEPAGGQPARNGLTVYPRVCGGTRRRPGWLPLGAGLSPRVRGNLILAAACPAGVRSIPACAGEPRIWPAGWGMAGVYPRVCGGTAVVIPTPTTGRCLSPRVRGNLRRGGWRLGFGGSIPACAGEPSVTGALRRLISVYPRVCGGTTALRRCSGGSTGLSPRVRGNRGRKSRGALRSGSIPACAGEPCGRTSRWSWPTVYPRVCGGTNSSPCHISQSSGLSPRVRGNRLR